MKKTSKKPPTKSLKAQCVQLAKLRSKVYRALHYNDLQETEFFALRQIVLSQVAEIMDILSKAQLISVYAWQDRTKYCELKAESAVLEGDFKLNCSLQAVSNSNPPPTIKIRGIRVRK